MLIRIFLLSCLVIIVYASVANAAEKQKRLAIVLASFGSTVQEAQAVESAFVETARKRYPDVPVLLANTARMVMRKNEQQGRSVPSLFRALADLSDQGYTHVAVQSLQIIPGAEHEGIEQVARAQNSLPKGLKAVSVGLPLIASNQDAAALAAALLASLPAERKKEEPVVFVGHGTHHGLGGLVYPALQWHLKQRDPLAFVGTIEGIPSQQETIHALPAAQGGKAGSKVWLAPLLALAGDHAKNDLFGDEDDSWKSALRKSGRDCGISRTPLLALSGAQEIWFSHLDAAIAELGVEAAARSAQ